MKRLLRWKGQKMHVRGRGEWKFVVSVYPDGVIMMMMNSIYYTTIYIIATILNIYTLCVLFNIDGILTYYSFPGFRPNSCTQCTNPRWRKKTTTELNSCCSIATHSQHTWSPAFDFSTTLAIAT